MINFLPVGGNVVLMLVKVAYRLLALGARILDGLFAALFLFELVALNKNPRKSELTDFSSIF